MFCVNCGKKLEEGDRFCTVCGWPVEQEESGGAAAQETLQPAAENAGADEQQPIVESAGEGAQPPEAENPAEEYQPFTGTEADYQPPAPGTEAGYQPPSYESPVENKSPAESQSPAAEGSVILPDALLFYEGGAAFVYAMDGDGRLVRRQVETGRSFEGTKTEILSGLTGEDYLAYPEEAAGKEGAKARIVYGEEMEIGTEESEAWEETES